MITTKIKIFFFFLAVLIVALSISLWMVFQKESLISSLENSRFELYAHINAEKKNSSDFSNLVNKYIILNDVDIEEYLSVFIQFSTKQDLLKKRNSALSEYNYFFKPTEESKIKEIQLFLNSLGMSNKMFKIIFKLNEYEKEILFLEVQAINFYNGYTLDDKGIYSEKILNGKAKAKSVLHSYKYQILKDELNASVDNVLDSVELLMQESIQKQKQEQQILYYVALIVLICLALLLIAGIFYSHNYLIRSLELLKSWTKEVKKGTYTFKNDSLQKDEISLLMESFNSMAQTIKNNIYKLEQLSLTDALTKLYNRRALNKILEDEYNKFERYNIPCSIVILDIDNFKKVNDSYGHDVGDTVLKDFSRILNHNIRKTDTVGRWGGEEFLIICPNTNKENVKILANSLRKKIEDFPFTLVGGKTASFGVAQFHKDKTLDEILIQADEALYEAKAAGRNCVM